MTPRVVIIIASCAEEGVLCVQLGHRSGRAISVHLFLS